MVFFYIKAHLQPDASKLAMIRFAPYYFKTTVELFQQNKPDHTMGKGKIGKGKTEIPVIY